MPNRKVYLAKHILATGLDVEYVKSNLSRIKGIDIIENGMSFKPSECAAFIIVPGKDFDVADETMVGISKNIAKDLKEFIKNNEDPDYAMDLVYIYTGRGESEDCRDVETTTPLFVTAYSELDILDKDNFNHYGEITTGDENEQESLLELITDVIGAQDGCWLTIPRHHQPAPQYAIPAIPSVEERKLNKMGSVKDVENIAHYERPTTSKKRLLIRRFR